MHAALRGCHVLVVAPARKNDPSVGFPWHAVVQELFTRLVVVQQVFGEQIRAGGGDLRVGLFSRSWPLDAWIIDRALLRAVIGSPGMSALILDEVGRRESMTHPPERGLLVDQARLDPTGELAALREEVPSAARSAPAYFATGSMNLSIRSLALDGDAMAVVAGAWALHAIPDLVLFTAGGTWVETVDDLEALYPPLPFIQRKIGWWLRGIL